MNVRLIFTGTVVVLIHMVALGGMIAAVKVYNPEPVATAPADQADYSVASAAGSPAAGYAPVAETRPTYVAPAPSPTPTALPVNNVRPTPTPAPVNNAHAAPAQVPPTAAPADTGMRFHVVKSGDNFWKLSKQYNVKIDDLLNANGFTKKDTLQVGVRLKIPGGG